MSANNGRDPPTHAEPCREGSTLTGNFYNVNSIRGLKSQGAVAKHSVKIF